MIVTHAQQSHTRLGNVSLSSNSIDNSKELVPVLVRRILGFNRAKCSVKIKRCYETIIVYYMNMTLRVYIINKVRAVVKWSLMNSLFIITSLSNVI